MFSFSQLVLSKEQRWAETLCQVSFHFNGDKSKIISVWSQLWKITTRKARLRIRFLRKNNTIQIRKVDDRIYFVLDANVKLKEKPNLVKAKTQTTSRTYEVSPKSSVSSFPKYVQKVWNKFAEKNDLQQINIIGSSRRTKILARTKDYKGVYNATDLWVKVIGSLQQNIERCPSLKKQIWFNFDYIVRNEAVFDKALSGKIWVYSDNVKSQQTEVKSGFKVFHRKGE